MAYVNQEKPEELSLIYILSDGVNSKIGITSSLKKRMDAYATHNPTAKLFKTYSCLAAEAKQIEQTVKVLYKAQRSARSREWFEISPFALDTCVASLVKSHIKTEQKTSPLLHGANIPDRVFEALDAIKNAKTYEDRLPLVRKVAENFANTFNLGTPAHLLPENVVVEDCLTSDLKYCDRLSPVVREAIQTNHYELPFDDHKWRFYSLSTLSSGHIVAFCTTRVSMPYLGSGSDTKGRAEIIQSAKSMGWEVTFHPHWSWHSPGNTDLIAYQAKSPIHEKLAAFDKSFRKWVIENKSRLENGDYEDRESLLKHISDIVNDDSFPLDVTSFEDLYEEYHSPFFNHGEENYRWLKDGYQHLFNQWFSI